MLLHVCIVFPVTSFKMLFKISTLLAKAIVFCKNFLCQFSWMELIMTITDDITFGDGDYFISQYFCFDNLIGVF